MGRQDGRDVDNSACSPSATRPPPPHPATCHAASGPCSLLLLVPGDTSSRTCGRGGQEETQAWTGQLVELRT